MRHNKRLSFLDDFACDDHEREDVRICEGLVEKPKSGRATGCGRRLWCSPAELDAVGDG